MRLNGVDPVEYLTEVYRKLVANWPASRIAEFTPCGWKLAVQAKAEAGD